MILRKPYAILIKYFRTIHIVMFVFFAYLVFALRKIYIFFSDYIANGKFSYIDNMANIYVPWILFFLTIILLGLAIGILLLMNKKEKPVLFYKIMIGYSVTLLAVLIYFSVFFTSLARTTYDPLQVVINRDISLFMYIINFAFVILSFIRGFGFDIKKFSFDRDKKELNLEESDNEEYELNVNIEKEDIITFFNRQKREFTYYVQANKLFFTIISSLILVCLVLFIYFNYFVINKVYKEKESISIGGVTYIVNNSFVTKVDKYGQEISKESDYLVVDLNIYNKGNNSGYLDQEALRINVNNEYFYPMTSLCDLFSDLGTCYKRQELNGNSNNNFIVVYKIGKDYQNIYFEILKNKNDDYNYSKVLLSYQKASVQDIDYRLNENISINSGDLQINSYKLDNKASYTYEDCTSSKCHSYIKRVMPNTGDIVLIIEFNNLENVSDDFLNSAIGLKYNDKVYGGKQIKLLANNKNVAYYSIPDTFKNTSNAYLVITTRNYRYNLLLEGE